MSLPDLPPPTFVQDPEGMERMAADVARHAEVAVDTEADSFYSYREKVCLVQLSAGGTDYLIDPLAGVDLAPLGAILADPEKTKVFHDGEYDILIMKRVYGFAFAGLFDTRVAAAALGMEAPGLASVLRERFGVELDKSMQRSNWAKRPLTDKQVSYARLDTHFLVELMHELREELEARGRTMIVEGECRRLEQLEPPEVEFRPDEFVRVKGVRGLEPQEQRRLRELYVLREKLAQKRDVPPFRIMNNQVLLELARRRPKREGELDAIKGFSSGMVRRLGRDVLAALARADAKGPLARLPHLPKKDGTGDLDEDGLELYDRLKEFRKGIAAEHGIESSYLLNRHVMLRIAEERPGSNEDLAAVEGLQTWQRELFGAGLVRVVREFAEALAAGRIKKKRWRRR